MRTKLFTETETEKFLDEHREDIKKFMLEKPRTRKEIARKLNITEQHLRDIFTKISCEWPIYEIDDIEERTSPGKPAILFSWLNL